MSEPLSEICDPFVPIELSTPTGEVGQGQLPIQVLSDTARTRRALKAAGTAFGVGVVLIVVPLMHIVGPLVAWTTAVVLLLRRLGERERLLDCKVTCPKCGGEAPIAAQRLEWPMITVCSGCRWQITVRPAAARKAHETGASAAGV